jgi:hypothetical protein
VAGRRAPQDHDQASQIFGLALRAAGAVADAPTAAMLLRPFRIDDLDHGHADSFGKMAGEYGQSWTAEQVRTWFTGKPGWGYTGGPERSQWVAAKLPRRAARAQAGFGDLAADCAARLRARLARPPRTPGDWSVELPADT